MAHMAVCSRQSEELTLNSHPACLGCSHPLLGWSDTEDVRQPLHPHWVRQWEEPMENGRIEPVRALPFMGGTALPTATPGANPIHCTSHSQNLRRFQGPLALAGSPQLLTSSARGLPRLGVGGRPPIPGRRCGGSWWRLLEARMRRPISFQKREDDLFEVGIEGVALNPNRK